MTTTPSDSPESEVRRSIAPLVSGLIALACYLVFIGLSLFHWNGGWIMDMLHNHYVFFVGLPFAALVAHFLVGTLENTRGEIQFEAGGVKFKGASGPIIMWVIVFLALTISFAVAWGLQP